MAILKDNSGILNIEPRGVDIISEVRGTECSGVSRLVLGDLLSTHSIARLLSG